MNCVYLKQLSDQIKITSDYLNSLISQLNAGLQAGSHPAASTCSFLNKPAHVPGSYIPPAAGVSMNTGFQRVTVTAVPGTGEYIERHAAEQQPRQEFRNYQLETLGVTDKYGTIYQKSMRELKTRTDKQKQFESMRDHINRNKNTTNKRRNIIKKYKEGLKNKLMQSTLNTESVRLPSVEALLASANNEDSPLTAQAPKNPTTFFSDQDKLMDRRINEYKKREEKLSQ